MPKNLVSAAGLKFLAVAHHDFLNPDFVRAALGGIAADRDGVAGLDGTLRPPDPGQAIGAGEFPLPFLGGSGIVLGIPEDLNVRIDEFKSCDGAFHRDRLARIVICRSMMCERRGRKGQQPDAQRDKAYPMDVHINPC